MRRQRTDSTAAAVQAVRDARLQPQWPVETVDRMSRAEDQERADVIFRQITTSRAASDFRDHDLTFAAQLAVVEVDIAKLQAQIDREGYTALGGKSGSTVIKNPLLDAQQHLVNRQIQLARALGLVGAGTDLRQVRNAAKAAAEARALDEVHPGERSLLA